MRTKETTHLLQSRKEIKVAIETDGDRIGGLLNERNPLPVGEGEPVFDYPRHMKHLVVQLDTAADQVVDAEDVHLHQLIRVSRFKIERDENVEANYGKLVSARQGLESVYKRGSFELALVTGDTPRVPEQLYEQLGQTVTLLRQPAVEPGEHKVGGFRVDFDEVATDLENGMPGLRAAIDRLDGARKVAEGTLVVKQEAIGNLHRTILWVGRTTEGLFHLAGEDELAKRIRSSTRRSKRPSEEEAQKPSAEDGSADEPSTEAESST